MGIDATKPAAAAEMVYKRIRVPGEEKIDVAGVLARNTTANWRDKLGG
jgi:2,5-furandicarboxylate decarboxylase 1